LEPYVSWMDQITASMARKVGSGSYDYRRADRRLILRDIFAPSRSGHGAGTIVVAVDSSGSIYGVPKLIERFFAETSGVLTDLKPRKIWLLWCDSEVKRVDDINDEMDLMHRRSLTSTR
jgi:predicted metal-dependent peptidase